MRCLKIYELFYINKTNKDPFMDTALCWPFVNQKVRIIMFVSRACSQMGTFADCKHADINTLI